MARSNKDGELLQKRQDSLESHGEKLFEVALDKTDESYGFIERYEVGEHNSSNDDVLCCCLAFDTAIKPRMDLSSTTVKTSCTARSYVLAQSNNSCCGSFRYCRIIAR